MKGFLLDTNVISETRKTRPDGGVIAFLIAADAGELFLSVLTVGELRKGVAAKIRTEPLAAKQLAVWVDGIETSFADRLLPIDVATASRWGELSAGHTLPVIDTLIAASAISHGLTLVTRSTGDFAATGVPLVDPWQPR